MRILIGPLSHNTDQIRARFEVNNEGLDNVGKLGNISASLNEPTYPGHSSGLPRKPQGTNHPSPVEGWNFLLNNPVGSAGNKIKMKSNHPTVLVSQSSVRLNKHAGWLSMQGNKSLSFPCFLIKFNVFPSSKVPLHHDPPNPPASRRKKWKMAARREQLLAFEPWEVGCWYFNICSLPRSLIRGSRNYGQNCQEHSDWPLLPPSSGTNARSSGYCQYQARLPGHQLSKFLPAKLEED